MLSWVRIRATAVYGSPLARRTDESGKTVEYDLSGTWRGRG